MTADQHKLYFVASTFANLLHTVHEHTIREHGEVFSDATPCAFFDIVLATGEKVRLYVVNTPKPLATGLPAEQNLTEPDADVARRMARNLIELRTEVLRYAPDRLKPTHYVNFNEPAIDYVRELESAVKRYAQLSQLFKQKGLGGPA
jgi:hypothetical protein